MKGLSFVMGFIRAFYLLFGFVIVSYFALFIGYPFPLLLLIVGSVQSITVLFSRNALSYQRRVIVPVHGQCLLHLTCFPSLLGGHRLERVPTECLFLKDW